MVLNSKLFRLEVGQITRKYDSFNAIQILRMANSPYLGKVLYDLINKDASVKAVIYQMVLETDQFIDGTYGSRIEKDFVFNYYNMILRDAMNYCISQKVTVQWSGIFDKYCAKHEIYGPALLLQYAKTDTVTTEDLHIEVPEEYIEITLKKLKPVNSDGTQVTPKRNDQRKQIEEDWRQLFLLCDEIMKGKTGEERDY